MKLKNIFYPVVLPCVAITACSTGKQADKKPTNPNILFILIDDMGWTDLGCYGSNYHETPHIDQLAKEGVRFTNAYAACPVCSPTRASILTGKYPATLNLTDWIPGRQSRGARPDEKLIGPEFNHHLPLEEITIVEKLKEKGYVTASIGKWHLGDSAYFPGQHGFDLNISGNHRGSPASYYTPFCREGTSWCTKDNELLATKGNYLTDALTASAIDFISDSKDTSFFLYLSFYTVHIPIQPKKELLEKYRQKWLDRGDTTYIHTNPHYAAMIETLDNNVGRLMSALDSLQLLENTLIFLFSDNGGLSVFEGPNTPATTNIPLKAGKGHLYEGGIREPLIIYWKDRIEGGKVIDEPVISNDFFPTIMEYAGLDHQENEGRSIVPLLEGGDFYREDPLFWHYPHYSNQGGKPGSAVRQGKYKLIQFYEENSVEMYDLHLDISEKNNIAEKFPAIRDSLLVELAKLRQKTNARLPVPNPEYEK